MTTMAARPVLLTSVLLSSMLIPALASAGDPGIEGPEPERSVEGPQFERTEDPDEAMTIVVAALTKTPVEDVDLDLDLDLDEVYMHEPYVHDPHVATYESKAEPEASTSGRRTTLKLTSGYFGLGIAPGMTVFPKGFHPNTRLEMEFGGTLEHRFRDLGLSFGVVTQMTPYFQRKTPSFGADVTSTLMLGPIYLRTGFGAVGNLPRRHLLHQTAPGVGGVVGVGLNLGRAPMIRVGVDYDLRVTPQLEPVHTFFLAFRIVCCRKE
jgi:hypothetical protein